MFRVISGLVLMLASSFSAAQPQVLAKVVEREFHYSFGLSVPGTLGVAEVAYGLEVVDAWQGEVQLAEGQVIELITSGGCETLMEQGQRYLVELDVTPVSTINAAEVQRFRGSCKAVTEATAQATISELNRQRASAASALQASINLSI